MRFAILAADRYLGVFEAFVDAGWQPLKLFTSVTDNRVHRNAAIIDHAARLGLDVRFSRITEHDIAELGQRGCDALVVAGYSWRIGDWRPHLPYAVNFHPSPLPEERGPFPLVHGIIKGFRRWGVTCHKVTQDFDAGDILDAELFPIAPDTCHESLDLRTQMAAKRLAARVAGDFEGLWRRATPQQDGSYSGSCAAERTLDFSRSVDEILRRVRAFGLMETVAKVNGVSFYVRRAIGWTEAHEREPGTLVHVGGMALVVAARDGYIGIAEWNLVDPDARSGTPPR
ncbi:MAG TPA: formyltransferase family protein [Rhodocyclaceae bacterium]